MVQVTVKPVNFTEEGKELIRRLTSVMHSINLASNNLTSASCFTASATPSALRSVSSKLTYALMYVNDALAGINSLKRDGLLKPDLPVASAIEKHLSNALNDINDALNECVECVKRVSSPSRIRSHVTDALMDVSLAEEKVVTLSRMYYEDPPDVDALLSLGKVVGVAVALLVVAGAVLKHLPD